MIISFDRFQKIEYIKRTQQKTHNKKKAQTIRHVCKHKFCEVIWLIYGIKLCSYYCPEIESSLADCSATPSLNTSGHDARGFAQVPLRGTSPCPVFSEDSHPHPAYGVNIKPFGLELLAVGLVITRHTKPNTNPAKKEEKPRRGLRPPDRPG